jgi:hypothetical protein
MRWRGVVLDVVVRNWTDVESCQGVGPQSFRHIVATHIIKTTLGNYFLAARALHDSPITVERSYALRRSSEPVPVYSSEVDRSGFRL